MSTPIPASPARPTLAASVAGLIRQTHPPAVAADASDVESFEGPGASSSYLVDTPDTPTFDVAVFDVMAEGSSVFGTQPADPDEHDAFDVPGQLAVPEQLDAFVASELSPFGAAAISLSDVEATTEDDPFDIRPKNTSAAAAVMSASPVTVSWGQMEDLLQDDDQAENTELAASQLALIAEFGGTAGPSQTAELDLPLVGTDEPQPFAGVLVDPAFVSTLNLNLDLGPAPTADPAAEQVDADETPAPPMPAAPAPVDMSGFDPSRYFGVPVGAAAVEAAETPVEDESDEPSAAAPTIALRLPGGETRDPHDARTIRRMLNELTALN